MEAKAKSFTFLSNEGKVVIPFFQRSYVWDETNWQDLFDDLLNLHKNHFLGSVILKQSPPVSGEPKEVVVIDGQQRLTTLSILIKSIYDTFSNEIKQNTIASIRNYLFYKKYTSDSKYLIRVQHSQIDSEAFQSVVNFGIDSDAPIISEDKTKSKIIKCYWFFIQELNKKSEKDRIRLFNSLLDPENKILVVIDLTKDDDEQSIFDTINSAGVRLTSADIIKNAIFQKLKILLSDQQDEVIGYYKNNWEKYFLNDEETIQYWNTQRATGRFMRDNIEILLHSIAVIKGYYSPESNTLSELSKIYKDHIETLDAKSLISLILEISGYAQIYRDHLISFDSKTILTFSNSTQRLFHILDVLQISTFHPFILYVLKNNKDHSDIDQCLLSLEKFIIRRMIAGNETKSYNKLTKEFIDDPDCIAAKYEDREKIVKGIQNISNKNAALILFWIELARRNQNKKYDTSDLQYNYTLEHIMPQKWEEYWSNIPAKKNIDGNLMTPEQAKTDRNLKLYWLGNMTLLKSSLNSSLRNYEFSVKMVGQGKKKGIKDYASLSITNDDIVLPFNNGDHVWDESKIESRTSSLLVEIENIWG
jgi:uncharacterized protein with ParB-like and HNH nuclease domain